jgi:hypothetical protein
MPRQTARRGLLVGLLVTAALAVAACGSSGGPAAPTTAPPGMLTKAQFVTQADAVCKDTDAKLSALPQAKDNNDYSALLTDFTSTLAIYPAYFAQAERLVAQSTDRAELTRKWLKVEEGDFAASKPIIEKIIAALQAKDDSAVTSANRKLQAAPNHTDDLIVFFKSYGLSACASLESAGASDADS